jgi:16S rRNA (cytosine967-C5)-methyltransferase
MTPSARLSAGIEILDVITSGEPAEKVLTRWGRQHRYAGSKDRAAIRDLVFDVLRKKQSCAAAGGGESGGESGRGLVLGHLRLANAPVEELFSGAKYAPDRLSQAEADYCYRPETWPDAVRLDYPGWLDGRLRQSLGGDFEQVMALGRTRAASFVRVNSRKSDVPHAIEALGREGIIAKACALAPFALEVVENARKISQSDAYKSGLIELQDAASQAVVAKLELPVKGRILDYCAGGGGKALAMAASSDAEVFAHDINPARMADIPVRASRAGARVTCLETGGLDRKKPYDLVFCDAPCSGSGAWRRSPASKWELTPERLLELTEIQADILQLASRLVMVGGRLAYATCSVLAEENIEGVEGFLRNNSRFHLEAHQQFTAIDGADGMFISILLREK